MKTFEIAPLPFTENYPMEKIKKHTMTDRYGKAVVAISFICICSLLINSIFVDDHALKQISPVKPLAYLLNFLAGCEGRLGVIGSMSNTSVLKDGQWWRLLTHIYLHSGIIHMIPNVFALLFAGKVVEKKFGSVWFVSLFHLIAVVNAMILCLIFPDSASVGASAGIFGIIGIVCVLKWKKDDECKRLLKKGESIYLIVFSLLSLAPGLESFATHLAAFVFGVFAGLIHQKFKHEKFPQT